MEGKTRDIWILGGCGEEKWELWRISIEETRDIWSLGGCGEEKWELLRISIEEKSDS